MAQKQIVSFRDLEVWNLAMDLVLLVYDLATGLPNSERFELSSQLRRAAVSIPSNIAEGHARRGKPYRNHVLIALGSTAEIDTQIEIAVRLGLLDAPHVAPARALLARVGQMLHGLERSLKRQQIAAIGSSLAPLICAIGGGLLMRLWFTFSV
jgi:four helix bundle protein